MAGSVGHAMRRFVDETRQRPILVDAWYPAGPSAHEEEHDYGLGRGRVAEGASPAEGRHPVVVLSHGAFGAASNYSWIAEYLAGAGWCVAGVSHFGESFMHGVDTIDPACAAQPWLRPPDCTIALDRLLVDPQLGPVIDDGRVAALGHSSGGATAIALGGAVYDPDAMQDYCDADRRRADRGCDYARAAPPLRAAPDAARRSYRDRRVRAVVALDPALGPGFRAEALAAVEVPVLIVAATDNDFLPYAAHGAHYAASIPGASLHRLDGGEGHFAFLDVCDSDREANGVALCRDRPGVDRRAVHAAVARLVATFLERRVGERPTAPDPPGEAGSHGGEADPP